MGSPRGLGRADTFPLTLGGGESTVENIFAALLEEYRPKPGGGGFDVSEGSETWCEAYAEAVAVGMIYACNERAAKQMIPECMQENLPVWEEVLGVIVVPDTPLVRRRAVVAAALKVLAKNALTNIAAAARKILGRNYSDLRVTAEADVYFYMPGLNPGPPGWTFTSNRAVITILANKVGINEATYVDLVSRLSERLFGLLPGWMRFEIGTDSGAGWVPNVGIVDQTVV